MASKPKKSTVRRKASARQEAPMVLTAEALADLRYIEPTRSRERVISMFNELYVRVFDLAHMHKAPEH